MNAETCDLAGLWTLADAKGQHACAITLPGDCISALHDTGGAGFLPGHDGLTITVKDQ